ncbi:hypothetical protein [Synechococcus sp. M16CYN]|uniref:hypothetical protein n=1 Tax=Synechococcus sp. M16CYN TaxID=3103139 RepID=UPI003254C87D
MNAFLAVAAVANPVVTALLTFIIFLEKDKIKKRSEELEAALKASNQELVQTVESITNEVKKVETAQVAIINAVKDLEETLKNTVSL